MREFANGIPEKENPDMENRLIEFANLCICVAENLPNSAAGKRYAGEIIRSSGNTARYYSKIQQTGCREEYHRNLNIILNEIRVSRINLKIISRKPLLKSYELITAIKEANELYILFEDHNRQVRNMDSVSIE